MPVIVELGTDYVAKIPELVKRAREVYSRMDGDAQEKLSIAKCNPS